MSITPLDSEILRIAAATRSLLNDPSLVDQATAEVRDNMISANGGEPLADEFLRGVCYGAYKVYGHLVQAVEDEKIEREAAHLAQSMIAALSTYVTDMRQTIATEALLRVVGGE